MPFLFYFSLLLIVYGSLYPFDFSLAVLGDVDMGRFLAEWRLLSSRGDLLGNVALFAPYGFFGMLAVRAEQSRIARFAALAAFGLFVAAWLQVLQLMLPTRDAALGDVIWNAVGLTIGALAALPPAVRRLLQIRTGLRPETLPLALMACWLAAELAPFVPSIDFQSFKDSLRPLILSPVFSPVECLRGFAGWTLFAYFARRLPGEWGRVPSLALVMAATVAARVLVVDNAVSASDAVAMAAALVAVSRFDAFGDRLPRVALGVIAAYLLIAGLEPFGISATGRFHWLPFAGSLSGSMATNLQVLAGKIFFIGSVFLIAAHCNAGIRRTALVVVPALALLEIAQLWIGNHTAEITDPFLAAVIAACLAAYRRRGGDIGGAADGRVRPDPATVSRERPATPPAPPAPGPLARPWLTPSATGYIALGIAVIAVAAAMNTLLGLPKIPYNVRELFGGNDSWWRLGFFALAIFCFGMGGTIAGHRTARSSVPWLALPGYAIPATVAIYALLAACVTAESLADVAGSSNTYFFVTEKRIWGDTGIWLYRTIGSPSLIAAVERIVRFVALFGPFLLWLTIVTAVYFRVTGARHVRSGVRRRILVSTTLGLVLAALPWLFAFKYVAFSASSTDNLNELIVDNGIWLYPLMILLPVNMLAVAHALAAPRAKSVLVAAGVVALSLPVGWVLFRNGLSAPVEKYGLVFTGADFLLGPDRREILPRDVLMARWAAIQLGAVAALAFGMRLLMKDPPRPAARRTEIVS